MELKLNRLQREEVLELASDTSKEFAKLVMEHVTTVSKKELIAIYDEYLTEEENGEYVHSYYDSNFSSVANHFYDNRLSDDWFKGHFGHYGNATLYMDDKGQGLFVERY